MDAKNMTTHLLQISSKYGVDTTWNMADYAGNITAQVRRAFEPENMSRTWTIEHWQLVMARMLTAVTGTKMDTAKTFQVNTTVSPDVTVYWFYNSKRLNVLGFISLQWNLIVGIPGL